MSEYIKRLMRCGWRVDRAWTMVNDLLRELDFDGLEMFIRQEELKLCG